MWCICPVECVNVCVCAYVSVYKYTCVGGEVVLLTKSESCTMKSTKQLFLFRVVTLLTILLPALLTMLTAVVHVILLTSTSTLSSRRSAGLRFFDNGRSSRQYAHHHDHPTSQKMTLINSQTVANVSALTLCSCVSAWMAVTSVRTLRQRTARTSLGVTGVMLYICCVSTLWTRDVMTLFQQSLASSQFAGFGENWDRLRGLQAGFVAVSAVVILLPILGTLFQLCSVWKRRDHAWVTPNLQQIIHRLWTSGCIPRLAQAAAVTLALCALLLTFLAIPLPWVTLQTSYSRDFQPLAAVLRNVSMHLEQHAVAMDTLVTLPVCAEDKMAALSGEMEYSKDTVSRLGVDQIEQFCLQYECPDMTAMETNAAQREYQSSVGSTLQDNSEDHLSRNKQGNTLEVQQFNTDLNLHETSSDTSRKIFHGKQSSTRNQQQTRSPLCKKFCVTMAYFQGSMPFNASVHKLLAREVKGKLVYESLHLKSLILKEKTNLLSRLDRKGALSDTFAERHDDPEDRNGDVSFLENVSDSHMPKQQHGHPIEENDELGHGATQVSTNNGYSGDEADYYLDSTRDTSRNSQRHFQHHRPSSNFHVSCMQTLCALQAVSQVGLAAPLLGLAFQAVHLAVQAMTVTLKLIMKVEELSVVFEDLRVRLESLALYMEHGVQEKVVHLEISNYSMVSCRLPGSTFFVLRDNRRRSSRLDNRQRTFVGRFYFLLHSSS